MSAGGGDETGAAREEGGGGRVEFFGEVNVGCDLLRGIGECECGIC